MRIAQQENSVEKRGWVAWFMRKTNKTSSQGVCTTYVGCRCPSVLPWERRHCGLPSRILEAQAKLVSLAGLCALETQPEVERENDMRRPVFWGTDPIFNFSRVCFYTQRCYTKVMWGQQSWLLLKSGVSYRCIQRSLGCYIIFWPGGLLTIYDPLLVTAVSQPEHLFLQEWLFLKQTPPPKGTR